MKRNTAFWWRIKKRTTNAMVIWDVRDCLVVGDDGCYRLT